MRFHLFNIIKIPASGLPFLRECYCLSFGLLRETAKRYRSSIEAFPKKSRRKPVSAGPGISSSQFSRKGGNDFAAGGCNDCDAVCRLAVFIKSNGCCCNQQPLQGMVAGYRFRWQAATLPDILEAKWLCGDFLL